MNKATILIFLIFLSAIAAVTCVLPTSEYSEAENRSLVQRPSLSADAVRSGAFQEAYETSLSDQFPGRAFLVSVKTRLLSVAGMRDINGVYLAKDAYLIEKQDASDFDEARIAENEQALAGFLSTMTDRFGSGHVHALFVPSKGTVLSDKLPAHAQNYDSSGVADAVKDALTGDASVAKEEMVLDLFAALSAHSEEYLYYRTDHHWTTLGACYAYNAYRDLLGLSQVPADSYRQTVVTDSFYGTSFDKVQKKDIPDAITRFDPPGDAQIRSVDFDYGNHIWEDCYSEDALFGKDKYRYFFGGNTACIHIATKAGNDRALLVVKDSFANCFVPFLTQDYADIYMVDLRYTKRKLAATLARIEEECALTDVLVLYNREKFMQDTNLWKLEGLDGTSR